MGNEITGKLNLYLDNCCFNRPYNDQNQIKIRIETEAKLFIQSEIKNGNYLLFWSYILSYENSKNNEVVKRHAIELWKDISSDIITPNKKIDFLAEDLNNLGIKEIDALHIVCAISGKCDYFITTDNGILKKREIIKKIKILNPLEFIENTFGGNYDDR